MLGKLMKLEIIVLSKIRQIQKDKKTNTSCFLSHAESIPKKKTKMT
jgi:hypothetical protein